MAAGKHGDRGADLQVRGAGQRICHADERIDRLAVDEFGEPQRINAGRLEMVDDGRRAAPGRCPRPARRRSESSRRLRKPPSMLRKLHAAAAVADGGTAMT